MAVGMFGEIFQHVKAHAAPFIPTLLPVVVAGLQDDSPGVRRNAAFCSGVMALASPETVAPHYLTLLQHLHPLFQMDPTLHAAVIDNAAAAVARMMTASLASVPTAQVMPFFLGCLPLKDDMNENEAVYSCLAGLIEMKHPDAMAPGNLPAVLHAVSASLAIEEVDDELKGRLVTALAACCKDAEAGPLVQTAMSLIPPESSAALLPHLQ